MHHHQQNPFVKLLRFLLQVGPLPQLTMHHRAPIWISILKACFLTRHPQYSLTLSSKVEAHPQLAMHHQYAMMRTVFA
eukprot:11035494-Karenia_brevis.AAC.1